MVAHPQQNYATFKKENLVVALCISKFQDDLFNQKVPSQT